MHELEQKVQQDRQQKRATIRPEKPESVGRKRRADGEGVVKAAKADKKSETPVEQREVPKEELKLRIIHALALRDLTIDQVSKQCLRDTEKEAKGAKVSDVCNEVADWGKDGFKPVNS